MELEDHAMRISDNRYEKHRQQHAIALRFLAHEARTQTIRAWTGLTDDRIRSLYGSYLAANGSPAVRHRGKSPQQAAYFWRNLRVRKEAGWLASIFLLFGLIKNDTSYGADRREWRREWRPDLNRAELLCQAFDAYVAMVPSAFISFEHAVFLAHLLVGGEQIRLGACPRCGGILIKDRLSISRPRCDLCNRSR